MGLIGGVKVYVGGRKVLTILVVTRRKKRVFLRLKNLQKSIQENLRYVQNVQEVWLFGVVDMESFGAARNIQNVKEW